MSVFQGKDLKKKTGGRKRKQRDKRLSELGNAPANPTIGKTEKKTVRMRGGYKRPLLKHAEFANVYDSTAKAWKKATMRTERENPANRNFARMNILTKGAVIDTDIGLIKITNRPGQDGVVNAILVKDSKETTAKTK